MKLEANDFIFIINLLVTKPCVSKSDILYQLDSRHIASSGMCIRGGRTWLSGGIEFNQVF